jgi:hypothetical protein
MVTADDIKALIEQGDNLFDKRGTLLSMWQSIADNFYPERADFTVTRTLGDEFAEHLTTSYPLLVRRDFGNSLGTMMRPKSLDWFKMRCKGREDDYTDQSGREWLEWASGVQKRAMYERRSQFTRASKEGDHDIASFGQCVKSISLNRDANGLLYRCWHLRDCAWAENDEGMVDTMHRKWKPTARELYRLFPGKVHAKVDEAITGHSKNPYSTFNCRHIVIPADQANGLEYIGKRAGMPFVSIYIDVDNKHVMEVVGRAWFEYVVPRWQTVSGSQYAFSPSTVCALPDGRLLQAMAFTLLEAGEKAVNPPMTAVGNALRSDLAIYAGGVTYVDESYDERTGEALRVLSQDKSELPFGLEMTQDLRGMLREAFYLDKLSLPAGAPEMTAYEVSQRVADYIRQAAPIFEPLEEEDNAAVCETTFDILMRGGAFGSYADIPQSLKGEDIGFRFESPLHDAIERQKGVRYREALELHSATVPVYPEATAQLNFAEAFRDALGGAGVPAKWMNSESDAEAIIEQQRGIAETQQLLETMGQGADVAAKLNEAGNDAGGGMLAA